MKKKFKRALGVVLAIALMLTSLPFSFGQIANEVSAVSTDTSLSLTRPSASMTVTEVTRVAYAENSMQPPSESNSVIVKATPSGIPYMTSTFASSGYAGETPVATTITFTPGVELDAEPVLSCSNTTVKTSDATYSNGTYTWTVLSGTALVGSTLIFTATYDYSEVNTTTGKTYEHTYQTQAISYVESIATPSGISASQRTYENWGFGSTTQNRAYLASIILGKNTYGSVYAGGSGDGCVNFAGDWSSSSWTSAFGVMKDFSDSGSDRNHNVAYAADSNRPISYVYMDKSIQTTLSDLNLRFLSVVTQVASDSDEVTTDSVNAVFVTSGINQTFEGSDEGDDPANDATAAAVLGIGNPTVASIKNLGATSLMYLTGTGPESGKTADYTVAIRYQTAAGWSAVYLGMSHSIEIITYDKGALRTLVENIQNTDPTSPTTTLGADEYKGRNPQSWYYSSGYEDFLTAYNSARAVLANPRVSQTEINNAKDTLYNEYKELQLAQADYTYAKIYYDKAKNLDESLYTLSSWAKLQAAMDSYIDNYSILYQPEVDKVAVDILNAMNSLEYKTADYTELNKRLETVNGYINNAPALYGKTAEQAYNNWGNLVSTLTNSGCAYNSIEGYVVSNYLPITQQATVDGYVVLIDGAIAKLSLKGADLTAAYEAEANYSLVTLSYLVSDVETQLTSAYSAVVALHSATMEQQSEVDIAVANLNYWLNNLEYKPADTTKAIALIQTANSIDRSIYEDMSAVDTAVQNLEAKLDLDIRYQSEINNAVTALQSAIDMLTANSADYTAVDEAIARANEIDKEITEQYASTYGFTAAEFYSNWSTVESAINNVIRKLDVTNQTTVDGYATTINGAIDALEESTADYTDVTTLQNTANNILVNQSTFYTSDSLNALRTAYLAVQSGYKISRQAEVDAFGDAIQDAIDALVYVEADYTTTDTKITNANNLLATADQYEIEHPGYVYYTTETRSALELALAQVVRGLNITQQSVVNGYATAIQSAISALKYGPADYEKVNLALAKVPSDTSLYTTLSVATLNVRVKAVKTGYTANQQASVDKFATNIETAIAGLKYKTADYTLVTTAIANVPTDNSLYTADSWQLVQDAVNAVVYNREIIYQDEVDLYATAINDAVAALKYKPADYTIVETAIANVPANLDNYTDETVDALRDVISSVDYSLDITHQSDVNNFATQIDEAVAALTYKQADYSAYYQAKASALKTIEDGEYTQESIDAVNSAINNVDLTLNVTQQTTVDGYVTAINEAVAKLVGAHADYTELNKLKTAWDSYPEKEYYDEAKVADIDKAFEDVDYNLNAGQQTTVDEYVANISQLISSLTYKAGNYSAVDTALATIPSDLSLYTTETAAKVTEAVNQIEYGLDARSQTTIDSYATAINEAVAGLKYKAASYTKVNNALAKIPKDLSLYTSESVSTLNTLLGQYPKVTDIREQYIVDAYAQDILDAIDALEYKTADYKKANAAVSEANEKIATGWYTKETVDTLNAEIEKLVYNLDITHQTEVDIATENIVKATNDLVKKLADYTILQNILDLLDNSSSEIYNYNYSNYDDVMSNIADYRENTVSKNMNLTIDEQSKVDEMANTLQGYIDSLIKLENGEVFKKKDGSTTVMRGGYIYGLKTALTKSKFESDFVTMNNVNVTYKNVQGPFIGTGAEIVVKSATTGDIIGQYTFVIYGDVDGNSKVNVYDKFALEDAIANGVGGATLKAADLNGDGSITQADVTLLSNVLAGSTVLNHATGEIN